jgi:hypothetical protein
MFSTVSTYMGENKSIWGGVKAMNETITEVNTRNGRIAEKAGKQQAPTTGAAQDKAQVRLSFEEKILEVADQLSALAEKNKNAKLAAQVEFTLSSLDKLADDDLEETAKRVSGLARGNVAALVDYNITQVDLTELDNLTTQFHGVKSAPRTAIAGRAGETITLPDEISDLTSVLRNQLDKQMTKFRKSKPEFYAGYRSARVIVDRGGSGVAVQPSPAKATVSA